MASSNMSLMVPGCYAQLVDPTRSFGMHMRGIDFQKLSSVPDAGIQPLVGREVIDPF